MKTFEEYSRDILWKPHVVSYMNEVAAVFNDRKLNNNE